MAIGKIAVCSIISAIVLVTCIDCAFVPKDNYLIDCGSWTNTTIDGRVFMADALLSSTVTPSSNNTADVSLSWVPSSYGSALYKSARVFTVPSSYSLPIEAHGRHFIRLYFFPFESSSYNLPAATFHVSAQDALLLRNFRPQSNSTSVKEFSLNITHDTLNLTFTPSGRPPLAFVNAIEVVSAPDDLIMDAAQIVGSEGSYGGLSGQLLETIHRINVGGPAVLPDNDTLWRTWETDDRFILNSKLTQEVHYNQTIRYVQGGASQETAPSAVYSSARKLGNTNLVKAVFNVTWEFNVDPNSNYLIRFHLCDIVSRTVGEMLFDVYVNTLSAASNLDLSSLVPKGYHLATAVFKDYVLEANDVVSSNLSITIGTSGMVNVLPNGILNGLEILMINGSASVSRQPAVSGKKSGIILGSVLGAVAAAISIAIAIAIVLCLAARKRKIGKPGRGRPSGGAALAIGKINGSLGYRFYFAALQEATSNFDEDRVVGVGGFGKVYRGVLKDETRVAVKRGNPQSQQGIKEFHTEIELLSRLRHRHLVSLIGFCEEKNEMILVYEYMEKGTLRSHLYGSDLPPLSWKERLEICIGSARGLHYLHTGQAKAIIHRDVKSANILLDENLLAKVADFGLSKTGPELDQSHVSTAVKGSFGYLDPEYFRRQQLTEKSDVYSFGVVLLEVLCARPVIDPTLPREMVSLAEWGMKCQKRGALEQIVDPSIAGSIKPESLRKFGETLEKCLADSGTERPAMGDVLWNLEYALQLQDSESAIAEVDSITHISEHLPLVESINTTESSPPVEMISNNDLSDTSMSDVFSQLIKSEGR